MKSEQLRDITIKALDDLKGIEIVALDVRSLTTITDYMIICTGTSTRHVKALAHNVVHKAKEQQIKNIKIEGENESEWILVDLGDVVAHIMLAAIRDFYSLEDLWEPVKDMRNS